MYRYLTLVLFLAVPATLEELKCPAEYSHVNNDDVTGNFYVVKRYGLSFTGKDCARVNLAVNELNRVVGTLESKDSTSQELQIIPRSNGKYFVILSNGYLDDEMQFRYIAVDKDSGHVLIGCKTVNGVISVDAAVFEKSRKLSTERINTIHEILKQDYNLNLESFENVEQDEEKCKGAVSRFISSFATVALMIMLIKLF